MRNSLDNQIDTSQLLGIFLYVLLGGISVYATAESLCSSFEIPKLFAYIIGLAVVLLLAALLHILKKAGGDRKLGLMLFVGLIFLLIWSISLSTNTHKFFTMLKMNDIRSESFNKAIVEFNNLSSQGSTIANSIISDYETEVKSRIHDFRNEMTNEDNHGYHDQASKMRSSVEEILQTKPELVNAILRRPSCKNHKSNLTHAIRASDDITANWEAQLKIKLDGMRYQATMTNCADSLERIEILENIKNCNSSFPTLTNLECSKELEKAHNFYESSHSCIKNALLSMGGSDKIQQFTKALSLPVPSLELDKISGLLPFLKHSNNHWSSFWLSLAIAIGIDLGAFIVFYQMVLKD